MIRSPTDDCSVNYWRTVSQVTFTIGLWTGFLCGNRVVLNGVKSNWLDVRSGVPLGSVLGHMLFLVYVNDIDDEFTCKVSKFADDTKIDNKVTTTLYEEA